MVALMCVPFSTPVRGGRGWRGRACDVRCCGDEHAVGVRLAAPPVSYAPICCLERTYVAASLLISFSHPTVPLPGRGFTSPSNRGRTTFQSRCTCHPSWRAGQDHALCVDALSAAHTCGGRALKAYSARSLPRPAGNEHVLETLRLCPWGQPLAHHHLGGQGARCGCAWSCCSLHFALFPRHASRQGSQLACAPRRDLLHCYAARGGGEARDGPPRRLVLAHAAPGGCVDLLGGSPSPLKGKYRAICSRSVALPNHLSPPSFTAHWNSVSELAAHLCAVPLSGRRGCHL